MQLLRTECSIAIDSGADAMHLVTFLGEGGESIQVRLAAVPSEPAASDNETIARAAATMVQVAAFLAQDAGGSPSQEGGRREGHQF